MHQNPRSLTAQDSQHEQRNHSSSLDLHACRLPEASAPAQAGRQTPGATHATDASQEAQSNHAKGFRQQTHSL